MLPFTTFLCLSVLVTAPVLSLPFHRRDVVAPPVTAPNSSSVWAVATTQTVVWDTSNLPPYNQITNQNGQVILGHLGGGGLNLMLDHPLAQGFNITQGSVNVTVPNVPPRTDYIVVLMGDSGNASPTFAITGGSNSTSTPSPTSSSSSSSSTAQSSSSSSSTTGASSGTSSSVQSSATSTPVSSSSAPAPTLTPSSSSPSVINTITFSGTPSTTVVLQPTGTSTKTNGAMSMRPIGATCLSVALIISGLLL